ncbi:MAG: hypothetical protein K2N94_04240 [Lachnospiraceae bacterium]|nr:hypothetical protein [Lachnospiraceae bacterium]
MDLIQLKIEKDNSITKYIKIIRKFDSSLSIGTIKQRIDENDFVMGFDLEYYDVLEDLDGIDKKVLFRDMIKELCRAGAQVSIYQDGEMISEEDLDNWLETLDIIRQQIECDIERESGER